MAGSKNDVHFRVSETIAKWLDTRAGLDRHARQNEDLKQRSRHGQAKAELEMWHSVLQMELRRIRLTVEQASCIADVLNGTLTTPGVGVSMSIAWMECSDAFSLATGVSSYGRKWAPGGADPDKWEADLLDYLRELGPAADTALRYAISEWWQRNLEATADGFKTAGLRVTGE